MKGVPIRLPVLGVFLCIILWLAHMPWTFFFCFIWFWIRILSRGILSGRFRSTTSFKLVTKTIKNRTTASRKTNWVSAFYRASQKIFLQSIGKVPFVLKIRLWYMWVILVLSTIVSHTFNLTFFFLLSRLALTTNLLNGFSKKWLLFKKLLHNDGVWFIFFPN